MWFLAITADRINVQLMTRVKYSFYVLKQEG
jgi:hypothetical protein